MYIYDFEMPPLDWRVCRIPKPKKPGEFRKITIPNEQLMAVQRDILNFLEGVKELRPSIYAHGFIPYRSTLTGVLRHDKLADVILCADVKDFFDTFPIEPIRKRMLEAGLGEYLTEKILKACTYNGTLPQGGPCSPILTNIGMYEMDLMIGAYARRLGFEYSRYADDMTFSQRFATTGNKPRKSYHGVFCGIDKMLRNDLHIKLNKKKCHTIRLRGEASRRVTGIVIRQDGLGYNAPRKMRRMARAMIHNLYMKVKKRRGRIQQEDWLAWRKASGYVRYSDYIRSASEGIAKTADGFISEMKYNYLKEKFSGNPNQQCSASKHGKRV